MIKTVKEALDVMIDFYAEYFNGDCCNPLFNISKKVIDKFEEAKKFLYDMEKELNELKHYESVTGQLEAFNMLNRK